MNKLNIGWYSFACCEDSTIMFAEVLNDYFFEFKKHFNFIDTPVLNGKRDEVSPLDIAFVEGALTGEWTEKAKAIRARAKVLVAIGSCACTGMPSAHRNNFTEEQKAEIQHILDKFNYSDDVKSLQEVIKVDIKIPGCPMDLNLFMKTVNIALVQFGHEEIPITKTY